MFNRETRAAVALSLPQFSSILGIFLEDEVLSWHSITGHNNLAELGGGQASTMSRPDYGSYPSERRSGMVMKFERDGECKEFATTINPVLHIPTDLV